MLVAVAGSRGAFLAAGLFLPVVTVASWSLVRRLDADAAVPVDVLELLLQVPIFSVLAPRIVERMAREAVAVSAPEGTRVITEGALSDRFYVIAGGRMSVTRGGRRLRQLGVGDWFGELALLRDIPRTATVESENDVALWALERDQFLAAVAPSGPALEAADQHARGHYL